MELVTGNPDGIRMVQKNHFLGQVSYNELQNMAFG